MFKLLKRLVIAVEEIAKQETTKSELQQICEEIVIQQGKYNRETSLILRAENIRDRLEFLKTKQELCGISEEEQIEIASLSKKYLPKTN